MSSRRQWIVSVAAMLLGPQALLPMWTASYPHLSSPADMALAWIVVLASCLIGFAGVYLLPLRAGWRVLIALIWAPLAAGAWLTSGLVLACAMNRDCL